MHLRLYRSIGRNTGHGFDFRGLDRGLEICGLGLELLALVLTLILLALFPSLYSRTKKPTQIKWYWFRSMPIIHHLSGVESPWKKVSLVAPRPIQQRWLGQLSFTLVIHFSTDRRIVRKVTTCYAEFTRPTPTSDETRQFRRVDGVNWTLSVAVGPAVQRCRTAGTVFTYSESNDMIQV